MHIVVGWITNNERRLKSAHVAHPPVLFIFFFFLIRHRYTTENVGREYHIKIYIFIQKNYIYNT